MVKYYTRNNSKNLILKSLKYKNVIGENIIFDICKNGTKEMLSIFWKLNIDIFYEKDKYGNIPIFKVSLLDNYDILLFILKKCKNIKNLLNYKNKYGDDIYSYLKLHNPNGECIKIIKRCKKIINKFPNKNKKNILFN